MSSPRKNRNDQKGRHTEGSEMMMMMEKDDEGAGTRVIVVQVLRAAENNGEQRDCYISTDGDILGIATMSCMV